MTNTNQEGSDTPDRRETLVEIIDRWRERQVIAVMRWGLLITSPGILIVGIYYSRLGEWGQLAMVAGAFLVFAIVSFTPIPYQVHAAVMIAVTLIAFFSTVSFVGVRGLAGTFLISSFLLAYMLLGSRAAIATLIITVSIMLVYGWGVVNGHISLGKIFDQQDPMIWLMDGGLPLMMALVIGAGIWSILRSLDNALTREQQALKEVSRERSLLEEHVLTRTKELQESNRKLELAYENLQTNQAALLFSEKMASIGRLTAGIAHELNTPLAAVQSTMHELSHLVNEYQQSIKDIRVSEEDHHEIVNDMKRTIGIANRSAERSLNFVRSIKSQTRDVEELDYQIFDVQSVIKDALRLLAHANRRNECQTKLEAPTEKVELFGHPESFTQIIINLVSNAIDASTPKGGGEITISLSADGEVVLLKIRDQGIGMPKHIQPRIFEPMFTTKGFGEGTGLGLSIVHDIVTNMYHGNIDVTSTEGQGTVFTIRFPLRQE